jgi:hypothetical protein
MRRVVASIAIVTALSAFAAAVTASAASTPTPSQVVSRFKAQTGTTLAVDKRSSYPGHYAALGVPQSISNIGRYGRFTIWVVTSGNEDDVRQLLVDPHTGELGTPGLASIYWEHGTTIGGTPFWLGKKRYGSGIVLWWYGSERRVDATFKRLHRALSTIAAHA